MTWLLVALGAGVGAALRFTLSRRLDGSAAEGRWPTGTLLVNVAGSLLLGMLSAAALDGAWTALLGTGLCGGLTTFSALAVQGVDAGPRLGTVYLGTTIAASVAACFLGFLLLS